MHPYQTEQALAAALARREKDTARQLVRECGGPGVQVYLSPGTRGAACVPSTRFRADGSLIIRLLQAAHLSQAAAVEGNGTAFPLE